MSRTTTPAGFMVRFSHERTLMGIIVPFNLVILAQGAGNRTRPRYCTGATG